MSDQDLENILEDADNIGKQEQMQLENQIIREAAVDAQQGEMTVRNPNADIQLDVNIYQSENTNAGKSKGNIDISEEQLINRDKSDSQLAKDNGTLQMMVRGKLKEGILNTVSSRRMRNFDDDDSQDDGGDDQVEQDSGMSRLNTQGQLTAIKPNPRFKNYSSVFDNLIKQIQVKTMYPICSMIITYDSTKAVTVTKANDREYFVKMYDLEMKGDDLPLPTFEERVGGGPDSYIKLKEVEQSSNGKKFAVCYNDDGLFYLRTFNKETRTQEEIKADEVCLNDLISPPLNNYTMCIQSFPDPYITCTFISDTRIFINLFHNATLTHYHFIWNTEQRKVEGEVQQMVMECTRKNFPYKCFYNDERDEIYSFYRQGQAFIINAKDSSDYQYDRMTEFDLGQMYLVYNNALVARSSGDILFFKIFKNEETGERKWDLYHSIEIRGLIYYIKGNVRIQITTDEKVYFYKIDKETLWPELDNVMYNYMNCNQMMFGSKVRYGVTYKTNQRSFDIYRRKYQHDFKVPINGENLEGSFGLELRNMRAYLVAKVDKITQYCADTFQQQGEVPIQLLPPDSREPNQVIAMQKCQHEEYLAVVSGKILIMNEQMTNQLFIFKRPRGPDGRLANEFVLDCKVKLRDISFFKQVCMNYHFKLTDQAVKDTLIFTKKDQIFEMNFRNQQIVTVYQFKEALVRQPLFFKPNSNQTIFMISSPEDCLYVNLTGQCPAKLQDFDIDSEYHGDILCIKEIMYEPEAQKFFLLFNKYEEKLGFYILEFEENDPSKAPDFLIKWKNKLDIGDPNICILRGQGKNTKLKELIISYKSIFINTYNVVVMDISYDDNSPSMIFHHESFQLWESECNGILLNANKDFVSFNKSGMQVLGLGSSEQRSIVDSSGMDRMIHSLESVNFLRLDSSNCLLFACTDPLQKVITIQQEYQKGISDSHYDTEFWNLYNIRLHEITLRELLLFQSLYVCKTLSNIVDIVNDQPNPGVFYKSFLELNVANMTSILSFDSRSMKYLLKDEFESFFSKEYPLIYKNKIQKGKPVNCNFFYRSAIDSALKCNQILAVETIVRYVVKYQNQFTSSYLFNKNLPSLIEQELEVTELLSSSVFSWNFDLDEWPTSHSCEEELIRPMNESIFQIRKHYKTVFPEDEFRIMDGEDEQGSSGKMFKIKYSLNLLPKIGAYYHKKLDPYTRTWERGIANNDVNVLGCMCEGDEIEIFNCESVQDLIEFKWQAYGFNFHLFGLVYHMLYMVILFMYTNIVYISPPETKDADGKLVAPYEEGYDFSQINMYSYALLAGILYPMLYEMKQMAGGLADYFLDLGNYIDIVYIFGSVAMAILHMTLEKGPYGPVSKIMMLITVTLAIRRTFNYLRIFRMFSPIVTMIFQVLIDLNAFMLFFLILILLMSLMYMVIGFSNPLILDYDGDGEMYKGKPLVNFSVFQTKYAKLRKQGTADFTNIEDLSSENLLEMRQMFADRDASGTHLYEGWDVKYKDEESPGQIYENLGLFGGTVIETMRTSIADYSMDAAFDLKPADNYMFWIIWFLTVMVACIIFLNFIIAEASNSYNEVNEFLDQVIQRQVADLTAEAEEIIPESMKSESKFPQYLIIRKVDQ